MVGTASSTGDGRIVFVSSKGHYYGELDIDNLEGQRSYWSYKLYDNSKLFNVAQFLYNHAINLSNLQVMTAYALQRRLQLQNKSITVSSLHPGIVS